MSSSSPVSIRVTTQRRNTPHLQAYLEYVEFKSHWKAFSTASIVLMCLGAAGALTTAILGAAGVIEPGALLWAITNLVGASLLGGLGWFWWLRRRRPIDPNPAIIEEARAVRLQLEESLAHNRLHREMHPAAVALVEAAAHSWKRIQDTTAGPYWSNPNLPAHYQAIREKALSSADQAMTEVLLHLQSTIKPIGEPKTLMQGLHSILDAIGVTVSSVPGDEPLPEGFTSATVVAKGISDLAAEIEKTSIRAVTATSSAIDSGDSIRKTLEELRQIREAESELENELEIGR